MAIKIFATPEEVEFARKEYKHLHTRGLMRGWWVDAKIEKIGIAFVGDEPIGACMVLRERSSGFNLGIMIKQHYRKLGIGTALLKATTKDYDKPLYYWRQAQEFFEKTVKGFTVW